MNTSKNIRYQTPCRTIHTMLHKMSICWEVIYISKLALEPITDIFSILFVKHFGRTLFQACLLLANQPTSVTAFDFIKYQKIRFQTQTQSLVVD